MEMKAVSHDMGRRFPDAALRPVDDFFHVHRPHCRLFDEISGHFRSIHIADIYPDYFQLSVFVSCGHACDCIRHPHT